MDEYRLEYHDELQEPNINSSGNSPLRKYLKRRRAQVINLPPPEDDDDRENSDSDSVVEDTAPLPDAEKLRQRVSVKQALGGLFSPESLTSTTAGATADSNLFVVKRYSQGKTFRQRLSYLVFKHAKTSLFFRYTILLLTSIMVLLYFAEAIYIDVLLYNDDDDTITLCCSNVTVNFTQSSIIPLILVPKPFQIWALQTFFASLCLFGGLMAIYVRQEIHGSIFKNFHRNLDVHICTVIILGLLFFISIFYPPCLRYLFIPSFLYCWPTRHIILRIITQSSQSSFFRHSLTLRNTVISLATFMICFFISCVCVIHHFERIGKKINIFDSFWLTVVTFSTVGYGDVYPGHWMGKFFMMIFIISALVYLPSKLEKLWRSFSLHRKHYSQYQPRGASKHILLITAALKPLVLRDFINEFYSDPKQLDTHSVLLIEEELNESVKQLLTHPVWSQRITVLLGSGLRMADLARARARNADACFIYTMKVSGSTEEADRHTILCAWTLKAYAPKCKQYVHIIRPENKMHLHIADEIICEREITNSLLAMNAICPGISTVAALLMHTFQYEGGGYTHPDYQLYEKCSPCEIYMIKLDQSRYFHHFAGKNFLFSSVVAYRKFHVVLFGVRPSDSTNTIFNPGIHYIMKPDDTCYYISETREEYSNFEVVKPTSVQEGLWNASATIGLLSMYVVGIDPENFVSPSEDEEGTTTEQKTVILKRMMSIQGERRLSGEYSPTQSPTRFSMSESPPPLIPVTIQEDKETEEEDDIGSLDPQLTAEVTNWQEEAQVGVQLLKYHGEKNDKKPVVLLNVVPRQPSSASLLDRHSLPVCSTDHHEHTCRHSPNDLEPINEAGPEIIVVDSLSDQEDAQMKEKLVQKPKSHSHGAVYNFFHHSSSVDTEHQGGHHRHTDHHLGAGGYRGTHRRMNSHHGGGHHHGNDHRGSGNHGSELLRKSSSFFRLNLLKGDTGSVNSGKSSVSGKSDSSSQVSLSHVALDPLVVLELDDISEKEELENLEDGRSHDLQISFADEDASKRSETPVNEEDTDTLKPMSPETQFIKDQIPVLPYCGCEPLHCYLEPQRPLSDIQISSTSYCDQVKEQWQQKAILVYAEYSTPSLFHFIAPLRARTLPLKALKPIIFILATPPDMNFISVISELPMVYFLIGSLKSINDLIRAGIMCADYMVVLSSPEIHSVEHESLADAENIDALHKIARLFPHLRFSVDVTFRYNIRFLYTTPHEQWSLQHLRLMARKGDHLTYLFLPQVASGKAFAGSMLDTLLYQSYQKPHIINVFRQMVGCIDVEGSGFLWSVPITEELLKLSTYVRVFQRLVSTLGYIPIAVYRTSRVTTKFHAKDVKGFDDHELENLRVYLKGRLHSLGLTQKVDPLIQPDHQHFVFLNPSPDFILQEEDTIIVIRQPIVSKHSHKTAHTKPSDDDDLILPASTIPTPSNDMTSVFHDLSPTAKFTIGGISPATTTDDIGPSSVFSHSSVPSIPSEVNRERRRGSRERHTSSPMTDNSRPPTAPLPLHQRESSRNFFFHQSYQRKESSMSLRHSIPRSSIDTFEI